MAKHNVLCAYKGILLSLKREAVLVHDILWMNPSTLCKVNEARHKRPHIVDLAYMKSPE